MGGGSAFLRSKSCSARGEVGCVCGMHVRGLMQIGVLWYVQVSMTRTPRKTWMGYRDLTITQERKAKTRYSNLAIVVEMLFGLR